MGFDIGLPELTIIMVLVVIGPPVVIAWAIVKAARIIAKRRDEDSE